MERDWENFQQFVMRKYSHQNINISGIDAAHCKTYVIGKTCDHEHVGACE